MTVIAVDHTHVAADGLVTCDSEITALAHKKLRTAHGRIYALAGAHCLIDLLIEWHRKGADAKEMPPALGDTEWCLIVIEREDATSRKWALRRFHHKTPYADTYPVPFSDGAASKYAIGAMRGGLDAKTAVQIACETCVWAGGDIQVIDIAEALGLKEQLQAAE